VNPAGAQAPVPAGFWRRYAAWSLDWLLIVAVLSPLLAPLCLRAWQQGQALDQLLQQWVYDHLFASSGALASPTAMALELLADPALEQAARAGSTQLALTLWEILANLLLLSTFYFVVLEGGKFEGTPGKRLLRLRVRAADGGKAGFGRALVRHLSGAISWMLLNLGHAIAGWRRDRRALHDLIAGTQVVAVGPMPVWGRAWLGLQFALLLAVLLGTIAWFAWELWQIATL